MTAKNGKRDQDHNTSSKNHPIQNRRKCLSFFAAAANASALGPSSANALDKPAKKHTPRRALTGRDESGKSVFASFEITPQVVAFDTIPGLVFHEMYATEGIPKITGHEPDPMLTKNGSYPGPGGSLFRLAEFPPKRSEEMAADQQFQSSIEDVLEEMEHKMPGSRKYHEIDNPGMHTTDTLDYGVVIRGEMLLELDDGKMVHLRQGDCVVQNGTRHRWINPIEEPCLMAFVMIGGVRRDSR